MKDDITRSEEALSGRSKSDAAVEHIGPLFAAYVGQVNPSGSEGGETNLADMLADIMHWAKREGFDFEAALSTARMHFSFEDEDEDDDEDEDEDEDDDEDDDEDEGPR